MSEAHSHVPKYAGINGDRLRWAITATATIGFLLFGYDQGVMSGIVSLQILALLTKANQLPSKDYRRPFQQRFPRNRWYRRVSLNYPRNRYFRLRAWVFCWCNCSIAVWRTSRTKKSYSYWRHYHDLWYYYSSYGLYGQVGTRPVHHRPYCYCMFHPSDLPYAVRTCNTDAYVS